MGAELCSGYSAGQITLPAGQAKELGPLIQSQIDANAAMAAFQVTMTADAANAAPIFFGSDNTVSAAKWGFQLAAGANRQMGGGTGNNILVGRMYAYSASDATLHIEIFP
jgi:hypothetical protein